VWVTNQNNNTVTELRASDGEPWDILGGFDAKGRSMRHQYLGNEPRQQNRHSHSRQLEMNRRQSEIIWSSG